MNNEQNNVQNGLGTTESVNQVNVSPVENNLGQNIPVQPLNNEGKKKNIEVSKKIYEEMIECIGLGR